MSDMFDGIERRIDDKVSSEKLPVIGAFVWWGFHEVEIPIDELKAFVKQVGLDEEFVPTPEARGAASDAAKSLGLKLRVSRHRVADGFAISFDSADVHQNGGPVVEVNFKTEQVVEYGYTTKQLKFKTPYMETEFRAAFAKFLTVLQSNDLRTVVTRALDEANAIDARDQGGVKFVPKQHLDTVAKLRALVDLLKVKFPKCYLRRPLVFDTAEERSDLLQSAGAAIEQELADLETDVQGIVKQAADTKDAETGEHNVRQSTLQRRIDKFAEIREKATAYADLLAFKKEGVEERLAKLQGFVLELI
jgi:hypothetical protein